MNSIDLLPGGTAIIGDPVMILLWGLKGLFVFGFLIYTIFAFMVIRQVRLMGKTYKTELSPLLHIIAIAHFIVAVAVLIFSVLVL